MGGGDLVRFAREPGLALRCLVAALVAFPLLGNLVCWSCWQNPAPAAFAGLERGLPLAEAHALLDPICSLVGISEAHEISGHCLPLAPPVCNCALGPQLIVRLHFDDQDRLETWSSTTRVKTVWVRREP